MRHCVCSPPAATVNRGDVVQARREPAAQLVRLLSRPRKRRRRSSSGRPHSQAREWHQQSAASWAMAAIPNLPMPAPKRRVVLGCLRGPLSKSARFAGRQHSSTTTASRRASSNGRKPGTQRTAAMDSTRSIIVSRSSIPLMVTLFATKRDADCWSLSV